MTGTSASVVPGLALAQVRQRPIRWVLVAVGVALAVALLAISQALSVLVADRALRLGLESLPVGERSVSVSFNGFLDDPGRLAGVDGDVRRELAGVTAGVTQAQLIFRELAVVSGSTFFLGAADDLADRVEVVSGRLPESCTPTLCEVVLVGDGVAPPGVDQLGLEVVGTVKRTDQLLLSGGFAPSGGAPLLVADGVAAATEISALTGFQRVYGWVAPLDLGRLRALGVNSYLARSAEVQDGLFHALPGLILVAPDSVLRAEADRAERSARRFALLGGSAAALLLGFAVLGAVGLRRDQGELFALLRRRGATSRQINGLAVLEAAGVVMIGAALGLLAGAAVAWWLGNREGLDGANTAALAVTASLLGVALLAAAALLLVVTTLVWPPEASARAWRLLDMVLVVSVLLIAVALSRGGVAAGSLDQGIDPLLVLLPLLAALATGLLAARLWPPLARLCQHALPRRWLSPRLALIGGLRQPLRIAGTTAFLAATVCSVVFAGAYQSTLAEGAADRASFETGLDARAQAGTSLESPLQISSLEDYEALAPGAQATSVVRSAAGARRGALDTAAVQVLGIDPTVLSSIRRWDRVVGAGDPAALAGRLSTPAPAAGAVLPPGRVFSMQATGPLRDIAVTAWFRAADGRESGVPLLLSGWRAGDSPASEAGRLTAEVPDLGSPVTLYRLVMRQPTDDATRRAHRLGEGPVDLPVVAGTMSFAEPRVGTSTIAGAWSGWGSPGGETTVAGSTLIVAVRLTGLALVAGPGLGEAETSLPVLADPETAALAGGAGTVSLTLGSSAPITVRVVGTVPRFPTAPERFVVGDGAALSGLLDTRGPGEGNAREVWITTPDGGGSLRAPLGLAPYERMNTTIRVDRQAELAADPVARGASTMLALAALVALLVAAVALVLLVVSDRRDGAGELYAWEVDGVAPSALRRLLVARAASVVLVAVPLGLAGGLLLAGATARLVGLTATGAAAQPPPQLAVGGRWVAAVLLLGVVGALIVAAVVAALALREPMPERVRS